MVLTNTGTWFWGDEMYSFGDLYLNVTTALVVLCTLTIFALYRSTQRPDGFPPGPPALPIIGNALIRNPGRVYSDLHKKYGDIVSLKIVSWYVVIINSIDLVKEALIEKGVEFAGRPCLQSGSTLTEGYKDIIFGDYGTQWRYQRKLAHNAVRYFARKEQMEKLVFDVTPGIAKVLDGLGDNPFTPKYTIGQIVYNVLATMCFGKQYDLNQAELIDFITITKEISEMFTDGLPSDLMPIFKYLPVERRFRKLVKTFHTIFYDELKIHRETFDPENVRDLFDRLLLTQKEAIEAGEEEAKLLTDTHLVQTVSDLFGAGTETTTLILHWAVALLTEHPDIQEKVAKEMEEVIGHDRLPSLDDRGTLPYTEATIWEVFRYGTVVPLGVPHTALADTTLGGYKIPKGTIVLINQLALHTNPKDWAQPEQFRPEHFLDDHGKLLTKLPDSFLPFSCGRRVCLGEDFAKKEIFLLFTWLFGRYTFYKVPGKEVESLLKLHVDQLSLTHQPLDELEVCVKTRV